MSKSGGLKSCLLGTAVMCSAFLHGLCAQADPFKYSADEEWQVEETMTVRMSDPASGKALAQVSRMIMDFSVINLFPDGSALVKKECSRSYSGTSTADLKELAAPDAPPVGHLLLTGKGEVYLVQAKPVFSSPEEEELAAGFDFPDDLGALEKAGDTDEFLAGGRVPMDQYKIAPAGAPIGRNTTSGGFQVTRLKDEKLEAGLCEVHVAKRGVIAETVWFDRRTGKVLQRKIVQGNPVSVEILQVRRREREGT